MESSGKETTKRINTIKEIRVRTGLGIAESYKLAVEANFDFETAMHIATKNGIKISEAMRARDLKTHRLFSMVHGNRIGVLVEIACETDFAANTAYFMDFGKEVCLQIIGSESNSVEVLNESLYIRDNVTPFRSIIDGLISKLKENVSIIRFTRYEVGK